MWALHQRLADVWVCRLVVVYRLCALVRARCADSPLQLSTQFRYAAMGRRPQLLSFVHVDASTSVDDVYLTLYSLAAALDNATVSAWTVRCEPAEASVLLHVVALCHLCPAAGCAIATVVCEGWRQ